MPINQRNAGFISATYQPLQVADAPTIGAATAGDASASVAFTPPANVGGSAISEYYAVSNPDRITSSGASSPVTVTGLTNDTAYTFSVWALNTYGPSPFSGASGSVTPVPLQVALFGGGFVEGSSSNTVRQVDITTTGNSTAFGNLTVSRNTLAACSSKTRGVFSGGVSGATLVNVMDYMTFSSAANAIDFGDLSQTTEGHSGCASSTRGIFNGGVVSGGGTITNVISFITIASTGNTTDFGDMLVAAHEGAAASSPTRGLLVVGSAFSDGTVNVVQFITIASAGNATDFGDLTAATRRLSACASSTRALVGGGVVATTAVNTISFLTIASAGNATDFGDLTVTRRNLTAASSQVRGLFAGGDGATSPDTYFNTIDFVTIASAGNATDFGDLSAQTSQLAGCSSFHGGLQ